MQHRINYSDDRRELKTILVSFSGTGDFANSSTAESETSKKSDDKGNESVNAKLVSASNESTETSANTSNNATQEASNANETSQENSFFRIWREGSRVQSGQSKFLAMSFLQKILKLNY